MISCMKGLVVIPPRVSNLIVDFMMSKNAAKAELANAESRHTGHADPT